MSQKLNAATAVIGIDIDKFISAIECVDGRNGPAERPSQIPSCGAETSLRGLLKATILGANVCTTSLFWFSV
jgi:hypothetical protein